MKDYTCLYSVEAIGIEDKPETVYGVLFADSFTDAVQQLESHYFGSDLLKINDVELFDCSPQMTRETYLALRKELNEL